MSDRGVSGLGFVGSAAFLEWTNWGLRDARDDAGEARSEWAWRRRHGFAGNRPSPSLIRHAVSIRPANVEMTDYDYKRLVFFICNY